jgi:hypothetical protein
VTARLLTIMGSGETSPTMVKVHRHLLERLAKPGVRAVMLDTPFGFQENADELCAKAVGYFAESLSIRLEVASYRAVSEIGTMEHDSSLAALRAADYVFAGPGSPTYALNCFKASAVPALLAEKLEKGGAVTFASAAAVTAGTFTAPIYEIYKVGEEPGWRDGIDLTRLAFGTSVAVIPHFNNAEGGTHDTRYCYLGERRLSAMEKMLPDDAWVLGVDEHTALVIDLEDQCATVMGNGKVTVRVRGCSASLDSGTKVSLTELASLVVSLREGADPARFRWEEKTGAAKHLGSPGSDTAASPGADPGLAEESAGHESPFLVQVREKEVAFDEAIEARDMDSAVRSALDLEKVLQDWSTETFAADEELRGRTALRRMVIELGELARRGALEPKVVVGPFVEALLEARSEARAASRYEEADRIRSSLAESGVEIRDTPDGTEWYLR